MTGFKYKHNEVIDVFLKSLNKKSRSITLSRTTAILQFNQCVFYQSDNVKPIENG